MENAWPNWDLWVLPQCKHYPVVNNIDNGDISALFWYALFFSNLFIDIPFLFVFFFQGRKLSLSFLLSFPPLTFPFTNSLLSDSLCSYAFTHFQKLHSY